MGGMNVADPVAFWPAFIVSATVARHIVRRALNRRKAAR
jgi:hypothetical protein